MSWSWGRRAACATARLVSRTALLAGVIALGGCNHDGRAGLAGQPRGATIAFESIDGPPQAQFQTLVNNLNEEAQARRLAVISRESTSAYRVRGYLAAKVVKGRTTIAWVWDVFDRDERRALRISGEETAKERHRDAWTAADDAMLRRIARASMDQLASFLTSPDVAPGTPDTGGEAQMALAGPSGASPEAAGIFRIFQAKADPLPTVTAEAPATAAADSVPLPRRRPSPAAAVSARETQTLSALRK